MRLTKSGVITCVISAVMMAFTLRAEDAHLAYHAGEMSLDASEMENVYKEPGYSPYAGRNYPTKVLWGDTHLHTALSLDARAFGVTLGPAEAYRFARGDEVMTSHGERIRLSRPLDFLVVSDHSDAMTPS